MLVRAGALELANGRQLALAGRRRVFGGTRVKGGRAEMAWLEGEAELTEFLAAPIIVPAMHPLLLATGPGRGLVATV